jgi:serine/threonine-protein kinase
MFAPYLPRRPRVDLQEQLQLTLGSTYRFERELGGGGMSRVFIAAETSLGRRVVVKVLSPDLAAGVSTERFRKEIQLSASLQHPHIVAVLAAGQAGDVLYYTMPFIEGVTLRARLQQSGELPIIDAVGILRDVTRALAYAHRRGVAHRDIKPENIVLSEDGAMVVDFGVAKALSASTSGIDSGIRTGIGIALGTPAYMSPEQAAADPLTDHRSDLYSLGIVAYEMLAGFSPFAGRPMNAIFAAHASEVPEPIERRRNGVPPRLAAVAAIAVVGLAVGGWAYRARLGAASAAGASSLHTIAVLPFANMSESKADEAFSDGMTEELIGALGKIEGLRVKSAFSLKGSQQADRDVGKQLDVQSVVAGGVRRSGDLLRVSARLVNVSDGFQLWSDSYERELRNTADVFRVQDDITKAIVNALKLKLSLAGRAAAQGNRQTENLDAYKAFLNGRYFMAKRTPDGIRTAIGFFDDAVQKDPKYALAWDGLADANALLNTYAFVSPAEVFGPARQAVRRALELDSTLAEGYATVGYIGLNNSWDWPAVEQAFQRSIQLNPNYSTAHHWYSLYLDAMGRGADALKEIQRAVELDPVSLIINREEGRTYYYVGDNARALEQYRRTLELDPTFRSAHVWIARVHRAGQVRRRDQRAARPARFPGRPLLGGPGLRLRARGPARQGGRAPRGAPGARQTRKRVAHVHRPGPAGPRQHR